MGELRNGSQPITRHRERSAAIHDCGADMDVIARSESDAATRCAFHDPAVIANEVKQSRTPEYMDRHGLRPRDDDAGSSSVCGIDPDSGDSP